MKKENLDKRICDCENGTNTQTYREFFEESENEFGLSPCKLDDISEKDLNDYLDYLDTLWDK